MKSVKERFYKYFEPEPNTGCWLWTGDMYPNTGYGKTHLRGISGLAHRASYSLFVGPIPHGKQLDHRCRVRSCVNPSHLEPVSAMENLHRSELTIASINSKKTECPHGHPYSGDNLAIYYGKYTARYCRACKDVRNKKLAEIKRANRETK